MFNKVFIIWSHLKKPKRQFFRLNLSTKPQNKKITSKMILKEDPWIGVDMRPMDWDPTPDLTRAIEKGGWSGGIKHIKRKLKKR